MKLSCLRYGMLVAPLLFGPMVLPMKAQMGTSNSANVPPVPQHQAVSTALPTVSGQYDHAANGVGLRNLGFGTIRLRGIPPTADSAFSGTLYFGIICDGTCPATLSGVTFQLIDITPTLVATSPQPCWVGSTYGFYKADVTALLMPPPFNSDYFVDGVPSGEFDGADPWGVSPMLPLAEGATLLVIYHDPTLPPGNVYVNEGAVEFFGPMDVDNPLSPALSGSSQKLTIIGADGQVGSSTAADPSLSGEKTFLGPTIGPLTQIAGSGSVGDQDSDWNGQDGGPLNQLWDTRTHTVNGTLPNGLTMYRVHYESFGDCLVWNAHVLTVR